MSRPFSKCSKDRRSCGFFLVLGWNLRKPQRHHIRAAKIKVTQINSRAWSRTAATPLPSNMDELSLPPKNGPLRGSTRESIVFRACCRKGSDWHSHAVRVLGRHDWLKFWMCVKTPSPKALGYSDRKSPNSLAGLFRVSAALRFFGSRTGSSFRGFHSTLAPFFWRH